MNKRNARRCFTAVILGVVIVLVFAGFNSDALKANPPKFMLYWLLVGVLLLWVVVLVFIDMVTIRQDFVSSRRSILRKTIGDPELLEKLRDAQKRSENRTDEQEEQQ